MSLRDSGELIWRVSGGPRSADRAIQAHDRASSRLGPCVILSPLVAGGMVEVCRARAANSIRPAALAAEPPAPPHSDPIQRLSRFGIPSLPDPLFRSDGWLPSGIGMV